MSKPIFVLGLARNGTTWISNILCQHPEIAGVQHIAHWGIKESKIFGNKEYWGEDFREIDDFIRFLELYSSGDYFSLANGDKDFFYKNVPNDFYDFYFTLMDRYAAKKDSKYWLTKLDPRFYSNIEDLNKFLTRAKARYGNNQVKFVSINRNPVEAIESGVLYQGSSRPRQSLKWRIVYILVKLSREVVDYNEINSLVDEEEGIRSDFSDLVQNRRAVCERLCNYLNLKFNKSMLEDKFPANSSYKGRQETTSITKAEKTVISRVMEPLFESLPAIPKIILTFRELFRGKETLPIKWRLTKLKYFKQSFRKELEKGEFGLKQVLFEEKKDENQDYNL